MSASSDTLSALKNVVLLHERMDALRQDMSQTTADLKAVTEKVYKLNERVVRIETMIEMTTGRSASPLPKIEGQ
jgi:outer membrane murein-binding lipoprotein Lpp